MIDTRVKTISLELDVDEFALIVAAISNTTHDLKAGPAFIMEHPEGRAKMRDLLFIMGRSDKAEVLWNKLDRMRYGIVTCKHL